MELILLSLLCLELWRDMAVPSFDFLAQQLRGPEIDVNLYPNAARAGIAAGNALPSTVSSIVQGVKQGVDLYQDFQQIQTTNLQNQMREHEISQYPVADRNAEAIATINELKAHIAVATEEEQIDATKERLLDVAKKYQDDRLLRNQRDEFQALQASSDPLQQKQNIFSGKYDPVFAAYPSVLANAAKPLVARGLLSQQEILGIQGALKKSFVTQNAARNQAVQERMFSEYEGKLLEGGVVQQAANNVGLTVEQLANQFDPVPPGSLKETDQGLIEDPDFDKTTYAGDTRDWRVGDKIALKGAPKDITTLLKQYPGRKAFVDGTNTRREIEQIDREIAQLSGRPQPQTQPQPQVQRQELRTDVEPTPIAKSTYQINPTSVSQVQSVPLLTRSGKINVSQNPVVYKQIQSSLGLSDEDFSAIKPKVSSLLSLAETPPDIGSTFLSSDQLLSLAEKATEIGKDIARTAYKDPSTPKETEERKDEHNKIVEDFNKAMMFKGTSPGEVWGARSFLHAKDISLMQHVDTPEDLYVLEHQGIYSDFLMRLMNAYREQIQGTKSATLRAKEVSRLILQRTDAAQKPRTTVK